MSVKPPTNAVDPFSLHLRQQVVRNDSIAGRPVVHNHYNPQYVFESTMRLVRFDGTPRIVKFTPLEKNGEKRDTPAYARIDLHTNFETFSVSVLVEGAARAMLESQFAMKSPIQEGNEAIAMTELQNLGAHLLTGKKEAYYGLPLKNGCDPFHNKRVYWLEKAYVKVTSQRPWYEKLLARKPKKIEPQKNASTEELELFTRLDKLQIPNTDATPLREQWVRDYMTYVWKGISEALLSLPPLD